MTEITIADEGIAPLINTNTSVSDLPRSGADITQFRNVTPNLIGGLFAYRYSNSSVVLGTLSAIVNASLRQFIAIGVSSDLNEEFVCEVVNFPERNISGISRYNVRITSTTREGLNH